MSGQYCGVDFSSHFLDFVCIDEDTGQAEWSRYPLTGSDAFDRARRVRASMPPRQHWEDEGVIAFAIEDPRGHNAGALYRIQGGILQCLPVDALVVPLPPSVWRKTVGLPGNCDKQTVSDFAFTTRKVLWRSMTEFELWPQDACDAYCLALACQKLVTEHQEAA